MSLCAASSEDAVVPAPPVAPLARVRTLLKTHAREQTSCAVTTGVAAALTSGSPDMTSLELNES